MCILIKLNGYNNPGLPSQSTHDEEEKTKSNPDLEQGKSLPCKLGDFPPQLFGKPIEEIDSYYDDKMVTICIHI